jgi:ABC-type glutathione transport system ATPase component
MRTPVIDARYVAVTYVSGPLWNRRVTHAVKAMTFEIHAGETLGLVGESGSGKTTLGRVCLGLLSATQGAVLFERQVIGPRRKPPAGKLAVVMQHPEWSLNPRLTVGTSVAEPLAIAGGMRRAERFAKAARALEMVGLDASLAVRYPHELSGGQQQRVAIARALITEPRFIMFDEAVSALDVSVQTQVLNVIRDLQEQHGFAALFISHDLAATRYVSHRMAVMYAGSLMEIGPAERFYAGPRHPYSRALSISIDPLRYQSFTLKGGAEDISLQGCPLSLRCPWSATRCRAEAPYLDAFDAACHRADEVQAT